MKFTSLLEKSITNNATRATAQLLEKLKVRVSRTTIIDTIEGHPDFPSLYSITETLKNQKVENVALSINENELDELPVPFIAYSKKENKAFTVITGVNGSTISYLTDTGQQRQKAREEFVKDWGKVVVVAEPSPQSGEKDYKRQRRKEQLNNMRIPIVAFVSLLFVLLYTVTHMNWTSILVSVKFLGCIVAGFLLWFETDKSNPVLREVCTAGKNTDCASVLESKQAKLFNWISWSEIGFFYFSGGFILLLTNATLASAGLLAWLNLLALPYTVFSVFYQWKIAKQWCRLCLTVQGLLALEFIVSYLGYWQTGLSMNAISIDFILAALLSFSIPIFFWVFIKSELLKAKKTEGYLNELKRFKFNPAIFDTVLTKQKKITLPPEDLGIILGNSKASNTVIKVCNPYCKPCSRSHPAIDAILDSTENIKVQIIFATSENDLSVKPAKHLMALYEKEKREVFLEAFNEWYHSEKKDYEAFAKKYQLNGEVEKQNNNLQAMRSWCEAMSIVTTPSFFINGYLLPPVYRAEDVKYIFS